MRSSKKIKKTMVLLMELKEEINCVKKVNGIVIDNEIIGLMNKVIGKYHIEYEYHVKNAIKFQNKINTIFILLESSLEPIENTELRTEYLRVKGILKMIHFKTNFIDDSLGINQNDLLRIFSKLEESMNHISEYNLRISLWNKIKRVIKRRYNNFRKR